MSGTNQITPVGSTNRPTSSFGPVGPCGPEGPPGPPGRSGPMGPIGLSGPVGPVGCNGPAGMQGCDGPQGMPGCDGPQGMPGPAGKNGADAMNAERYQSLLTEIQQLRQLVETLAKPSVPEQDAPEVIVPVVPANEIAEKEQMMVDLMLASETTATDAGVEFKSILYRYAVKYCSQGCVLQLVRAVRNQDMTDARVVGNTIAMILDH